MSLTESTTSLAGTTATLDDAEMVSRTGMLGNMLVSLVSNVAKQMEKEFASDENVLMPRTFWKPSNGWTGDWLSFPESTPSYHTILQRLSRLGKLWINELVCVIFHVSLYMLIDLFFYIG